MKRQWTPEEAWAWYNDRPWIVGFNYVPACCASIFDMWQEYRHAERMPAITREIERAHEIGYNGIRLFMSFYCWEKEHDGYMQRLEEYLTLFAKNGIRTMIVFGNDCSVPIERYKEPTFGEQHVDMGYHGGIAVSPHAGMPGVGYTVVDDPARYDAFNEMVREIVSKYAKDERIEIWNIYNELGNGRRRDKSVPAMERFFATARACDPIQPLTADTWTIVYWSDDPLNPERTPLNPWEKRAVELSDVVSYHDYYNYESSVMTIKYLRDTYHRPLLNTEWLHRMQHNTVQTHLPLFYLERVGSYHWGFVAGLNQTYEPWESMWTRYERGDLPADVDFTKWQHDILRPNLRPYDPHEIETIKRYIALAEKDFEETHK